VFDRIRTKKANDAGFTLVEMLIVIVVLGILAGITVFGVSTFRSDAQASACDADVKMVQVASEAYAAKTGGYPTAIADLTGGASPYLKSTPSGTWAWSGGVVSRTPVCP
jgi:prepilin-type N-terminal cleavage/methylation domain-containing protein